jgi:predicted nucleotidyltransferase
MNVQDPNIQKIELIAHALGGMRDKVVFVGGCSVGMLVTDSAAAPVRVTYDVDLISSVSALTGYHRLERDFDKLGFKRDLSPDAPICRWRYQGIEVDLMPTDPGILGFANRWYPIVVTTAQAVVLPSGLPIQLIAAPAFVATKLEAYADRGHGNLLGSHDMEDIINVFDGREQLVHEINQSTAELRNYLIEKISALIKLPRIEDSVLGMISPDEHLGDRLMQTMQRLRSVAALLPTAA